MKKLYTLFALVITLITFAQAPQGFNYQATVRNSSGDLIVNTNVYFKFNVMQGSQTSLPVFTEVHYVPTDDLGQVTLVIGQGTATTGAFSELDWSLGSYYLGIELDTGSGYVAMGTTQLLSVPYALYAENSGNSIPTTPNLEAVLAENNSANNQQIKDLQDPTEAQDAVTKAYADALSNTQGLMNFNGWDNYQISNDNSTFQLEPNSFLFLDANNTTLIFPDGSGNGFGDVIYIYVVQDNSTGVDITLQSSGFPIRIPPYEEPSYDGYFGILGSGLNTIINLGSYWMVGDFQELNLPNDTDNDLDGYTENQGDCDDANSNVFPGAPELLDGIDNDCDGETDEDFANLPDNLGLVGSAVNDWGAEPDIPLVYQGNGIYEAYVTFIDGEIKFRENNDWANNWGDTGADGTLDEGGDNIAVTAGVYLAIVNWLNMTYTLQPIDTTLTDGDNNTYTTLPYGTQIWSTTNAAMVTYRDGTPIPQVTDNTEWANLTTGAWCYYNNDPANGAIYGKLYNWYAVAGIHDAASLNNPSLRKQFAPQGWHIPSDAEWTILTDFLGGESVAGGKMKSTGTIQAGTGLWESPNAAATNESGFTGLPAGFHGSSGPFGFIGYSGIWWSSSETSATYAWGLYLDYDAGTADRVNNNKRGGQSVRFVRD